MSAELTSSDFIFLLRMYFKVYQCQLQTLKLVRRECIFALKSSFNKLKLVTQLL